MTYLPIEQYARDVAETAIVCWFPSAVIEARYSGHDAAIEIILTDSEPRTVRGVYYAFILHSNFGARLLSANEYGA